MKEMRTIKFPGQSDTYEIVDEAARTSIEDLTTRLSTLETNAISVYSGSDTPTSDIGEDGDVYLVTG